MNEDIQFAADRFIQLMARIRSLAPQQPPPLAAGLSTSQMAIIDFVATSPGCGVKEIAHGLKLSTPSISVNLRHLEDAAFIARQPHPSDRRAVQISLTPKGRDIYDKTQRFRRQRFEALLGGLTPEERETLLALLEKALHQTQNNNHSDAT